MRKPLDYIFPDPPSGVDLQALNQNAIPRHVAVIMDGNGRWAKKRALNRLRSHKAGIEAVRETIRCANDLGVDYLTIYSFSTENWKRPEEEVKGLMELFAKTMLAEVDGLHEEHVRVRTIGDLSLLPQETRLAFEEAWEKTKNNSGMTLVVAVNYGSQRLDFPSGAVGEGNLSGFLERHRSVDRKGTVGFPVEQIGLAVLKVNGIKTRFRYIYGPIQRIAGPLPVCAANVIQHTVFRIRRGGVCRRHIGQGHERNGRFQVGIFPLDIPLFTRIVRGAAVERGDIVLI